MALTTRRSLRRLDARRERRRPLSATSPGSCPASISSRASRERLAGGRDRRCVRQVRELRRAGEAVDRGQLHAVPPLECRNVRDPATEVRLTELVSCGGCAAKYSAALLQDLVAGLAPNADPDLLIGLAPSDDAAVYRLDDERALVFTLDFFPPIVDDPATFGAIAATNALNDVFAMGGRPLVALSIAVLPRVAAGRGRRGAIFSAAAAKVSEAGGVLAGGHTLREEEPKYGLAVVGTVDPDRIWTKAGAQAGDVLYLTKPLGTGLLVHARADLDRGGALDAGAERRRGRSAAARSSRTRSPT